MALYNRKLTDEVQAIIVNALKNGLSNAAAASLARISEPTFYNWYNKGAEAKSGKMKDFHDAVDNARDVAQANYENVIASAANDGTWQAAAWWLERRRPQQYGKKEKITRRTCMRNAVHGVMFKGISGGRSSGLSKGHAALCPDGYSAHTDYFDNFFGSGDYMQYVELTNNGNIQPEDRIKISSKEYKIGMVCIINFNALRERLQKDGVSKGLNSLF